MTDPHAEVLTAFVFCGGAGLGALQVGMLRALVEHGMQPDIVTGTSSGSVNALVFAADPTMDAVDRLERLWLSARRRDLFRINPWRVGRGILGGGTSLAANTHLHRLLASALPVARIEDTKIPLAITLTDAASRRQVVIHAGDALKTVMASSAVPGLFPAVDIGGRAFIDGGITSDPPVAPAVELGATRAVVMPVGWPIAEPFRGNAVLRIADTIDWLCWRIADFELERASEHCRIELLPSPSTRLMTPFDLRATKRLIDEAYELTSAWLDLPSEDRVWSRGGVRDSAVVASPRRPERVRRVLGRFRRSG
jgi:NTE family protein